MLPERFTTKRLILRRPIPADAEAIFAEYATDPEVTKYLLWRPHASIDTVKEFISDVIGRWDFGQDLNWVITEADGPAIGMLGARMRGHKVDIGYVLGRRYWNRGYMTEAVTGLAEHVLAEPSVHRIWAVCDTDNTGSARVLEKSGFGREGVLRRWIEHPNVSSEPRDCFVYSRVR